jgi:hypothetical protein
MYRSHRFPIDLSVGSSGIKQKQRNLVLFWNWNLLVLELESLHFIDAQEDGRSTKERRKKKKTKKTKKKRRAILEMAEECRSSEPQKTQSKDRQPPWHESTPSGDE